MAKSEVTKRKFPVPWGLFIVLAVYAFAVLGYVWAEYWNSPEYKAAQKYANALRILGPDDGRRCPEAQLNHAFDLTMQAALLLPEERELVEHLERLRYRFEERHFTLRKDWIASVEMMAARTRRIEQSRQAVLVVGTRDRGWAPDQLLAGPERIFLWSLPGAVLIIAFWGYTRFSSRRVREQEHEADLKRQEREVRELGAFRRQIRTRTPDDLEVVTQPEAPIEAAPPRPRPKTTGSRPAVKRVTSSSARPAVKKKPE